MAAATVTPPPAAAARDGAETGRRRRRTRRRDPAPTRVSGLTGAALALLLAVSLLVRVWGIKQGLPYSYNIDEATHFVPRAIGFFSHDLNPHYFLNPPAYSYLLHGVFELWFGSADAAVRAFVGDPTSVFVVARVVAAVLGTIAVGLTYLAGRRLFNRWVGLLAAAILAFAFLPVFYSHLALNDVPTLAPVALALYGAGGIVRRGRGRDYVVAGVGVGLGAATKYTAGITLVCLVAACVCDGAGGSPWVAVRNLLIAGGAALAVFVAANPYAVLDFSAFRSGVAQQASLAAGQDPVKLGSNPGSGTAYYLWVFTWGLGWGPSLAAIGGGLLLVARRRLGLALVLVPAPIAFIVFMGDQQRFFGRWLLPVFPIVAILAAYGGVELVRWFAHGRRLPAPVAGTVVTVLMLAQSVVAVIHVDRVLSRPDTRNLTRAWMVRHVPAGARVLIEPLVPDEWASDVGRSLPWTPTGERWTRWQTWLSPFATDGSPLPDGEHRYVFVDQYERALQPALLDRYAAAGYCWIVLGSLQAGRAFADPRAAPAAVAYYSALAQRSRLLYHTSPFASGAHPVPFSFDWSIDYYPRQYRRPGPEMSVYRLTGGQCGA
ncbi:MAG: glycosyltransferase family 39 protein [Solirubrobacterales bacterium]|nr:glycosyltransferase family 39 protein [Solirubrobacterales bacterium]